MSDRGRLIQLTELINAADAGKYTLPEAVVNAYGAYLATRDLTVPEAPTLTHVLDAGALLAEQVRSGEQVDPVEIARTLSHNRSAAAEVADARQLVATATEVAAIHATSVAAANATTVVVEHLRPAFDTVLTEAREVAADLEGYQISDRRMLETAPPRVRRAVTRAHDLAAQRGLLIGALDSITALSEVQVQHDTGGMFASYRTPMALWPGWRVGERPRPIDAPGDPVARLVWLVTEGAPAEPWLPLPADRDARWMDTFGDALRNREAHAMSTRATAGLPV